MASSIVMISEAENKDRLRSTARQCADQKSDQPKQGQIVRKRNPRVRREASPLLSPKQLERIIIAPRMHLTLLCAGQGTREHVVTVAATFNVGIALAHLSKNGALQNLFENAQKLLFGALTPGEDIVMPEEVAMEIKAGFNQLDRYIGVQHAGALIKAIEFIDRAMTTGEGAEVVNLPG